VPAFCTGVKKTFHGIDHVMQDSVFLAKGEEGREVHQKWQTI
jgi:hypothetical protein